MGSLGLMRPVGLEIKKKQLNTRSFTKVQRSFVKLIVGVGGVDTFGTTFGLASGLTSTTFGLASGLTSTHDTSTVGVTSTGVDSSRVSINLFISASREIQKGVLNPPTSPSFGVLERDSHIQIYNLCAYEEKHLFYEK